MKVDSNKVSIYIHWPFCLSLCPYCDFNSHIASGIDNGRWIAAYQKEIEYFSDRIKGKFIKSIFFGGGTPSLMHPSITASIINKISSYGEINSDTEITLEANPTSYESSKFREFKNAGINRVSIGMQSFNDNNLQALGRKHSAKEAVSAIESAASIFSRYSFDLIYALHNQTLQQWQEEMHQAIKLANGHISLYQLTIEKGTPFYKMQKEGEILVPSNEVAADMYDWTNEFLSKHGYNRYEISNYARTGQECVHNMCYWNYDEYIGIGPGAHSRIHNLPNINAVMMQHAPEKWLDNVEKIGNGVQSNARLSDQEIIEELIMMGSRISEGIHENKLKIITNKSFKNILSMENFAKYQEMGLVEMQNNILQLTNKGMNLHNYLVPRLINH